MTESHSNPAPTDWRRRLAGALAGSILLDRGRRVYALNCQDFDLSLSLLDKALVGGYLLLRDYSTGTFPQQFDDETDAHQAEIEYNASLPGKSLEETQTGHMRKPFWSPSILRYYGRHLADLWEVFEQLPLPPGSRLLELGGGPGWMAELLAWAGYHVLCTSIAPHDILLAEKKAASFRVRELSGSLSCLACPMEYVDRHALGAGPFDGVYAYQALHHCHDWRKTLTASFRCLRPGGWLVLADEPNWFHTFRAYRVNRLSRTHEIGFRKRGLVQGLTEAGYRNTRVLRPRIDNWISPFWLVSQRPP